MKKLIIVGCLLMTALFTACQKEDNFDEKGGAQEEKVQEVSVQEDNKDNEPNIKDSNIKDSNPQTLKQCDEVFEDGQLRYHILGIRTEDISDDSKNLIINLEVLNHSSEEIDFSPFDRLTVKNAQDEEFGVNLMARVHTKLSGRIMPDNKIMGEVAFDITGSEKDDYDLYIGEMYEYDPAIHITSEDIGTENEEKFESSGDVGDYTIGVPVESEELTILVNSATVIDSEKEGKEILLIELDVTNNDTEPLNFGGFYLNGVYTVDGVKLDTEVNNWTFPNYNVESGMTNTGIISYYVEEGIRSFYMTVTPDLDAFGTKENIVFDAK